ncbi:hypothetical protein F5Y19DRAFT_452238 [Xylariaceae sp. FL1651]|nr:hypothetical protein F5Y19DRAFT_452238 [Xylariaceae sp. FL1651]
MSAPRTKRPFAGAASDPAQRQITSFFVSANNTATACSSLPSSDSTNLSSSLSSTSTQYPDNTPHLPASVQANLLSVGMRVRKSVPEGYKTGNYNAFSLWDENHSQPAAETMVEGQRSRANAISTPRELLPFCGIHKVGGLGTQSEDHPRMPPMLGMNAGPSTTPLYQSIFGVDEISMDDDVPELTSSQESVESSTSLASGITGARTRKRFFIEDEGDAQGSGLQIPDQLNLWRHHHYHHDISVSPRSLTPVGWNNNGRVMAVPRKGRLRAKVSGGTAAMAGAGQENVMIVDGDFEEANFLDRRTWEVDMHDA